MIRVILAEGLKLKKICLFLPVIVSVIFISMTAVEWYLYFRTGPGGVYAALNIMYLFLSFTVFLETTLLSSFIASTEHEAMGWKWMGALPISRSKLFLAKAFWVIFLLLITSLFIVIGMITLWTLYTDLPFPTAFLVQQTGYSFLAGLPVVAIQLWLSIQWINQAYSLSIGILGSVASLFISRSPNPFLHYLPWAYPGRVTLFLPDHLDWLGMSIGIGIALIGIAAVAFSMKDQYT